MAPMSGWRTAAITVVLVLSAPGCGGSHKDDSAAKTATPTASTSASNAGAETDIDQAGAKRIDIKGDWLAAGVGGVWLSADAVIYRLDPVSGRRRATIRVPQGPCEASDVGFGSVWTATCKTPGLARIDPDSNSVTGRVRLSIPSSLDGEGSVGAGEGAVWLVTQGSDCDRCRVARVNPRTMKTTGHVTVKDGAATVRTGEGSVWVGNPSENVVQQIDPAAMKVTRTIKTGDTPRFLDVGEGLVWILNQGDGTVTRIDPATGATASVDAGVSGEGGDLTVGAGSVWARGSDKLLTRIDPAQDAVSERFGPTSGSGAVIVNDGAVWVSAHDINTVWRLPLDTH
jgi:virginiamycin B lyase